MQHTIIQLSSKPSDKTDDDLDSGLEMREANDTNKPMDTHTHFSQKVLSTTQHCHTKPVTSKLAYVNAVLSSPLYILLEQHLLQTKNRQKVNKHTDTHSTL